MESINSTRTIIAGPTPSKKRESDPISDVAKKTLATPTLTGHLSSNQTSVLSPRPYLQAGIYEDLIPIVAQVKSGILSVEKANLIVHELIAKVLAYEVLDPDQTIFLPTLVDDSFIFCPFKPLFINLHDGNAAYLLLPEATDLGISPILSFRGTSPTSSSGSIKANIGFSAIRAGLFSTEMFPTWDAGRNVIEKDHHLITHILADCASRGYGKCTLTGHSLGGKLASSFAVEGTNAQYVKEVIAFNSPGVSSSDLNRYNRLTEKFKASVYTTQNDAINFFCRTRFLGEKFTITPRDIPLKTIADQHCRCILSSADCNITTETARKTMNKFRKGLRILSYICVVGFVAAIAWRIFGLCLPALAAKALHAKGSWNKLKRAYQSTSKYYASLSGNPLMKIESASRFYFNFVTSGNGHTRKNQ